jgi:glycosyltransferase involved in cell wall biosynthesis
VTEARGAGVAAGAPVAGKLRILVINWLDRENPQAGGAERHMHEVFGRLAAKGHGVTALVSGWRSCARRAALDGIDVHRSGSRYTFPLTAPVRYRRHLAGRGFDVVVEDLNKAPLFSPLWVDAPVVLIAHHLFGATAFQAGPAPVAAATWLLERPLPRVFRSTPTIAVSESTKEDLVRRGLRPELIEVIPNGIDLDHYAPDPALRETERPTLLYLGRLKKYKRVDLVLEAVALLAGDELDVELFVVGDGEEMESLRGRARSLGVEGRVRFLGFVDEERKLEMLRRAWVHVLTSPKEGWGISNLEAAACGTPSVVSDSPGLRESVVHGETGLLVPHGDARALASALGGLLRDDALRARMGRQARAFAETFSWSASADAVEAVLSRVVAESPPG